MQKHLVIFAKEPRIGRVKTRLAREIGTVAAWRFYRSMLFQVPRRLALKGPWKTWLAVSPNLSKKKRRLFLNPSVRLIPQGQGDLGQRMMSPTQTLPHGPFLVIGTDVAGIRAQHIRKAFKALGYHDAVFGPATDGGFWLVGLKRHPVLAEPYRKGVRWSHDETLQDCLNALKGKKVALVDTLNDVDDLSDFKLVKDRFGAMRHW